VTAPPARPVPNPIGRRLVLTPIGLDVVAALAHDPDGMRVTPLASAVDSPVSSVQAALRILMANEIVVRDESQPPLYSLPPHPARAALIDLAVVLPEAGHAIGVILRASPAVVVAAVDRDGFQAGLDPAAPAEARKRLLTSLAAIADARTDAPPVNVSDVAELTRKATVSVGLRARLASAVALKGELDLGTPRHRPSPRATPVLDPTGH
jgi:hypothetical protein